VTWLQAIWLGLVEGITEYLPVSSTGHLLLAEHVLGMKAGVAASAYAICIQGGAIAAVLGLYAGRVRQAAAGLLGRDPEGARLAFHIFIAFLPAAVVGLALDKVIERHLFGPWPIVAAWLVGGVAILLVERTARFRREHEGMDITGLAWRGAVAIGFAQCLALWPGTSRSLVTIIAGVFVGPPYRRHSNSPSCWAASPWARRPCTRGSRRGRR
jgi:undecaprenyl-diphosphatase